MTDQISSGNYSAAQPTGASSRNAIYTVAGITGLSAGIPLWRLGKAGKDAFASNGGKWASAAGTALKKNPWTALTATVLATIGVKLASKDSVNSQVSLGDRAKAFSAGMGTSAVASVTELGAAGSGIWLFSAARKAFQENGKKIVPALGTMLKRNPIVALGFGGATAASIWLEKHAARFQDKAISGKSPTSE